MNDKKKFDMNRYLLKSLRNFDVNSNFQSSEVTIAYSDNQATPPVLIKALSKFTSLTDWMLSNRGFIEESLVAHSAILFRNFNLAKPIDFKRFVDSYSEHSIDYTLGAAKRSRIIENIFLSTHHPSDEMLEFHNEMSYSSDWPTKIFFYCKTAPLVGGETPLVKTAELWDLLEAETKNKFEKQGVMYVRNIGGPFGGLTWQEVFKTNEKSVVEDCCRANAMDFQWKSEDLIELKWTLPASRVHAETGNTVWFNHAYFFNSILLNEHISKSINISQMPFYALYGDGSHIPLKVLEDIKRILDKLKISFPWREHDVLMLDNLAIAHGRNPYQGDREILVGMVKS